MAVRAAHENTEGPIKRTQTTENALKDKAQAAGLKMNTEKKEILLSLAGVNAVKLGQQLNRAADAGTTTEIRTVTRKARHLGPHACYLASFTHE